MPAVGAPGDLLFEPVDAAAKVREGELVYTAGHDRRAGCESRYPPAIPIGTVRRDRPRRRRPRQAASTSSRRPTSSAWTWCRC